MSGSIASFHELPAERRRAVHVALCRHALEAWNSYMASAGPIVYSDSVIGMRHEVDAMLPSHALEAVVTGVDSADIAYRYQEPIVAMQDDDLTFEGTIELAYYSIYNCYLKYVEHRQIDDEIIIIQALASQQDPAARQQMLAAAMMGLDAESNHVR